ncbi:MAG: hypothetical protein H7X95_11955, partial [Deltaproteobacteria bacterium]|nr:hypothetical protein [Deltaproteobacteria bacterium]
MEQPAIQPVTDAGGGDRNKAVVDASSSAGTGGKGIGSGSGGAGPLLGSGGASTPAATGGAGGPPVGTGGANASGGTGGGTGGATVGSGGAGTGGMGTVAAGPWAKNVQVGLVEVAQGTFVTLGEGVTVVPPQMRNASLIAGRPLFARVHVSPQGGFLPRQLMGVLTLTNSGLGEKIYRDTKMVSVRSDPEKLDSTFNFLVPAADVVAGATASIGLFETSGATDALPNNGPRFPATSVLDLAIKDGRMELSVVFVPFTGPGGALADTPARRKRMEDFLYDTYPVQKINATWHAPVQQDTKLGGSTQGFAILRDLRTKESASAQQYYHLLVGENDCSGCDFAGIAAITGDRVSDGPRRIAITVMSTMTIDGGPTTSAGSPNTTGHEIGHNHGRFHTDDEDKDFPYANAGIGANGYSLTEGILKSKTRFHDLMSYTWPRWPSDYIWRLFDARVRTVTAFAALDGPAVPGRSLQGFLGVGGRSSFGVVRGKLVDESTLAMQPTHMARIDLDGGETIMAP